MILFDIRMPDVSGKALFDGWRRTRTGLSERVVFLTGVIVSPDPQSVLAGTGRPYLSEPFDFADLLAALGAPRRRLKTAR